VYSFSAPTTATVSNIRPIILIASRLVELRVSFLSVRKVRIEGRMTNERTKWRNEISMIIL